LHITNKIVIGNKFEDFIPNCQHENDSINTDSINSVTRHGTT